MSDTPIDDPANLRDSAPIDANSTAKAALATAPTGHLACLDGLRGTAAMLVVLTHCCGGLLRTPEMEWWLYQTPLRLLTAPSGAVQIFFVLSGWVLAASLSRTSLVTGIVPYLVRRVLRIQPPYMFGLLLAWGLSFFYLAPEDAAGLNGWLRSFLPVHLEPSVLLRELLVPGVAGQQLSVGWSLYVEIVFSFWMPLMWLITKRLHWVFLLPLLVYAYTGANEFPTLNWSSDFVFGLVLFAERERLARWVNVLPGFLQIGLVVLGLALFAAPTNLFKTPPEILRVAIGCAICLVAVLHIPWVRRIFETRPLIKLGQISYSLYLVHFPILLLVAPHVTSAATPWRNLLAVLITVVPLSLLAGELGYRLVERPSIQLGRWCSRRLGLRYLQSWGGGA